MVDGIVTGLFLTKIPNRDNIIHLDLYYMNSKGEMIKIRQRIKKKQLEIIDEKNHTIEDITFVTAQLEGGHEVSVNHNTKVFP